MESDIKWIPARDARSKSIEHAEKMYEDELNTIFEQVQRSTQNYNMGFSIRIYEANFAKINEFLKKLGYSVTHLDELGDPSMVTIRW